MRLPYLNTIHKQAKTTAEFKGLNQNIVAPDNEFADMKNISTRHYPAASNRKPRGKVLHELANPNGLYYKNGLFYVDGTECYYKGEVVNGLSVSDSKKMLVGIGAYIVIYPDKIMFNTNDLTFKNIEVDITQDKTATFAPFGKDSVFTKITYEGIHNYFNDHDNITIEGCTDEQFNGTKIIEEVGENFIRVTAKIDEQFTQAEGLRFSRTAPDLDFVCENSNRLWGCNTEKHEIYASKLGDPLNWNNYEQISTDSYALTVGSDGDFTGCIAFLGYSLFFKENTIHMMYGDKPSNYSLNTKTLVGVKKGCEESLQIVNETLYYVGRNGVYSFDGSFPSLISQNITEEITDAHSSQYEGKLYISCKLGGKQTILVYDPKYQVWDKENDEEFLFQAYGDGDLYYIHNDDNIRKIAGDSDEVVEWFMESVDIAENSLTEKHVSKFLFNIWLTKGSEFRVYLMYDDVPVWERKGIIISTKNTTYTLPIIPRRCNKYRWKIEGKGEFKMLGMSREVEGGSEINGYIQYGYRK